MILLRLLGLSDNSEQEILPDSKQALKGAESVQSHNDEEKVQVIAIKIQQENIIENSLTKAARQIINDQTLTNTIEEEMLKSMKNLLQCSKCDYQARKLIVKLKSKSKIFKMSNPKVWLELLLPVKIDWSDIIPVCHEDCNVQVPHVAVLIDHQLLHLGNL